MVETTEKTFSFGDFELDGAKRLLLKQGAPISLNSKTLDLLLVLAENRGRVMSKNELLETVWENQFVEENNLSVHISALRKIFGEKKDAHQFIVTIPGKGYKFIAGESSPARRDQTSKPFSGEIIGRAAEIAEIKSILRRQNKCLLTLTGAGGSGKTTLARTIADECRAEFEDGVFFIELAAIDRAEHVAGAIAQIFDLKESGDISLMGALKDLFRDRASLLVLDNFEQVLPAALLVKELLDSASRLKILVTSRAALHLKAEQEKVVSPLAVPPRYSNLSVEQLAGYASIELFAVRARKTKPNFVLNEENAPVIAEICNRLDGLPLAIELAAARVKLLSPQAILERLENSLKLLTGGAGDLPERQRTMRDTIRWSYDLLTADEKDLFPRLAVFAGGFTVEAAEAVGEGCAIAAEPDPVPRAEILDSLSALVDSNLLVSKEQADGNARLSMLEVVREFALEQFQKLDDTDSLREIHARYFLALAEEGETFLQGEAGNKWLERLEGEHDNLRAALDWSLKNNPETAARIAAALRFFWSNHSHLSEGLRWSRAALQTTENSRSEARSKLLMSNGLFLKNHGDLEAARKSYEKCLAESRETNDSVHIVKANHGLAAVAVLQGDLAAAHDYLTEALALSRELGDELQTADSLGSFGDLEMCRGNLPAARPLLEECLTLSKKLGSERILTTVYFNLGTIDYLENFYESAAYNFAESLRIAEEMGNKTMIACALDGFAALAAAGGNHEQSTRLAGAGAALREEIGCPLEPAEESFREKYLAKTRIVLIEKEAALLYEQGRAMGADEAVTLAKQVMNDWEAHNFSDLNERIEGAAPLVADVPRD